MFKLKYIVLICLTFASLLACNDQQANNKNIPATADSSYLLLHIPEFKSIKLLFLDKTIYNRFNSPEEIDSLVSKKILKGTFEFYTFLDSTGIPLSKHYDSVVLNKEEQMQLATLLERYYAKDDKGPLKCGDHFQDAIVFYDSIGKPAAFIEICFGCGVFEFSRSLNLDIEKCNRDSMMNKLADIFNKAGVSRKFPSY